MVSVDVVISTKNRPISLSKAVEQAVCLIHPKRLLIFDASDKQDPQLHYWLHTQFNAEIFDARGWTFGATRNEGMKRATAEYVAMIDDDIILTTSWYHTILTCFRDPAVIAANGRLILGNKGTTINKISKASIRDAGGSGGACIYDRKEILRVGNFNARIHRGEDMELKLRIQRNGFKWIQTRDAVAFHPLKNLNAFLRRAKVDAVAWQFILEYSLHRNRFFAERFGSMLIMPVYYGWRTLDPRAWGLWSLFRVIGMLAFLTKSYEVWK